MGVYDTNPLTGKFELLGTELEVGQYRAAERAQYESRFTDPFYQEDWDRPLPIFTDQDDWNRPPPSPSNVKAPTMYPSIIGQFQPEKSWDWEDRSPPSQLKSPSDINKEMVERAAQIKSADEIPDDIWTDPYPGGGAQTGGFQDPSQGYTGDAASDPSEDPWGGD